MKTETLRAALEKTLGKTIRAKPFNRLAPNGFALRIFQNFILTLGALWHGDDLREITVDLQALFEQDVLRWRTERLANGLKKAGRAYTRVRHLQKN